MSDASMQLIPNATFSLLEESVAVKNAPASVATGQPDETLALFAGIYKSRQFSVAAAHQSFAGDSLNEFGWSGECRFACNIECA